MARDDGGSEFFSRPRARWRTRLEATPGLVQVYRWAVGGLGVLVILLGLVLIPFPGPGWLIVFIGVAILGTEFHWARRLHTWGWGKVQLWAAWVADQGVLVRAAIATGTFVFVTAVVWLSLRTTGVANRDFVPPSLREFARTWLFL